MAIMGIPAAAMLSPIGMGMLKARCWVLADSVTAWEWHLEWVAGKAGLRGLA